jgi:hypothetical protein
MARKVTSIEAHYLANWYGVQDVQGLIDAINGNHMTYSHRPTYVMARKHWETDLAAYLADRPHLSK